MQIRILIEKNGLRIFEELVNCDLSPKLLDAFLTEINKLIKFLRHGRK